MPSMLYVGLQDADKIAVFSKSEEKQIEAPQLEGIAPYYNDEALTSAGAAIQNAADWTPNAVVDRELITGQNPRSDHLVGAKLVEALERESLTT